MFTLHPRLSQDTIVLADFPLTRLCMMNDHRFPWFILVPRTESITEIHQLSNSDRMQLMDESCLLAETLMACFEGEKMNVAALGNIVPQLHVHHIVRFKDDIAWPGPVWGVGTPEIMNEESIHQRKTQLLDTLKTKCPDLRVL